LTKVNKNTAIIIIICAYVVEFDFREIQIAIESLLTSALTPGGKRPVQGTSPLYKKVQQGTDPPSPV
jgi:hypothetical protein